MKNDGVAKIAAGGIGGHMELLHEPECREARMKRFSSAAGALVITRGEPSTTGWWPGPVHSVFRFWQSRIFKPSGKSRKGSLPQLLTLTRNNKSRR